jgi:hypothetical protein
MRRAAGALVLALLLGGCTLLEPPRCPPGQERLRTAQLFFGRDVAGKPMVSEAEFRKFVDEVLTPRFPDGLTILDGGGQWKGAQNRLIRESAKVVIIVLPKGPDANERLNVVRAAYKQRFNQDSVLQVTQPACVAY